MLFFAVIYRGPSLPGETRAWFEVYFEIAVALSLSAILWHYNRWIAMFLILTVFMTFYPKYGAMSFLAGKSVFYGCLWYLFIVLFFTERTVPVLYKIMRIFVYINLPVAILQKYGMAGWLNVGKPTGLMANPLELAALYSICLPAFLDKKSMIMVPLIGILFAKQFLGFVSVGAFFISYLAIEHKKYWPVFVVIVVGALWWIFIDSPEVSDRLYVWDLGLNAFIEHPFGAGIGHWKAVFTKPMPVDNCIWVTAHNEFLQMLFELGILCAPIFAGYFKDFFRYKTNVIPMVAIIVIAVNSFSTFPFHIAGLAMISVTWMGILTIYQWKCHAYSIERNI